MLGGILASFFLPTLLTQALLGLPRRFPRFLASGVGTTDRTDKVGVEGVANSARNLRSSRERRSGFGRLKRRSEMLTSDALIGLITVAKITRPMKIILAHGKREITSARSAGSKR